MISSNNERVNNGQRNNNHRDIYNSPLHSPGSENTPGTPGRMNMRSKGRYKEKIGGWNLCVGNKNKR